MDSVKQFFPDLINCPNKLNEQDFAESELKYCLSFDELCTYTAYSPSFKYEGCLDNCVLFCSFQGIFDISE